MKITVTGSLGNISRILTQKLVSNGHQVKVITSNKERTKEIEQLKATPIVGSLEDYSFIKKSFAQSDAVYLMIPPNLQTSDPKQYIKNMGDQYANAIQGTNIKYAVNLSSIGSHLINGPGPTSSNFYVEQKLNQLKNLNVLHLRPGMFMTNFYGSLKMIRNQNMIGNNFDGSVIIPLTHPKDIADVAFKALNQLTFWGKQVQYIVSDEKNGFEIAQILGNAIGKPGLHWLAFSDEQLLDALVQNGMPEQIAKVYVVEIGVALKNGHFMEDYYATQSRPRQGTTLQDFSIEFATFFQQPQ